MSDGNIFYSQIDLNLQAELNARGRAGMHDRTDRSMNYMLSKIANVEIVAMVDQKHIDTKNPDNEKNILHRLGGAAVRSGAYLPTGVNGFLNDRVTKTTDPQFSEEVTSIDSSYRIPPFITSAEMQLNDHSMGLLNTSTVNIVIPNPDRDLDFMESVYARPGRAITMLIEHPDSAVITDQLLKNSSIQPKVKESPDAQKMNRIKFNGLIKSFTYSYQPDGTVAMVIYLMGTSNVYTDVSMHIIKSNQTTPAASATQTGPQPVAPISFYKQVYNEIDTLLRDSVSSINLLQISYLHASGYNIDAKSTVSKITDQQWAVLTDWNKKEQRYITLAYLIEFLNKYIISKQLSIAPSALILCNNTLCESNYLPTLVSTNPTDIWISGGTHDTYGTPAKTMVETSTAKKWYETKNSKFSDAIEFSNTSKSYPSHIYINLNVIDRINTELLKNPKDFKATNFLIEISKLISESTGNFINMKLISYPEDPDYLIYYDSNFKGSGTHNVTPYSVPMFANHPYGTIVRDFSFESKLPQDMQALMYTVNQSDTISEEKIAPFLNYMYNNRITTRTTDSGSGVQSETISNDADPEIKKELEDKYAANHTTYKNALSTALTKFADDGLTNKTTQVDLGTALKKHIQWPTDKINKSSQMTAAVYPMEASFTIDGINGLRYGDTVEFNALPAKYKNNSTFSIFGITHTVSTTGDWTTKVTCKMRPKFD